MYFNPKLFAMAETLKLFRFIRNSYQLLDIDLEQSRPNGQFNWKTFLTLLCMVLIFIATWAFVQFEAETIEEYANCFTGLFMIFFIMIFFIINLLKMPKMFNLIEMMEKFIELRAHKSYSRANAYNELNGKIEKFTKWAYLCLMDLTGFVVIIPLLFVSFVDYYIHDLKEESFQLTTPLILPFNWRTPFGYVIATIFIATAARGLLYVLTLTLSFYWASCTLFIAIAEDMSNDVSFLVVGGQSKHSHRKIKERFCKIIQHHSMAKQIVDEFNGIYQFITFNYFLWTTLTQCTLLFWFLSLLSDSDSNLTEMMNPVMGVFWMYTTLFLYCETGERVTHQFNILHEKLCYSDWYLFPLEMQRMFVIMICGTQEPTSIQGYANTVCTRDAFKVTVQAGFSYFTMLRRIDE